MQYVQTYKNIVVPESKPSTKYTLDSYKNVRLEWPDVLQAQREYIEARLDYVGHLVEAHESCHRNKTVSFSLVD